MAKRDFSFLGPFSTRRKWLFIMLHAVNDNVNFIPGEVMSQTFPIQLGWRIYQRQIIKCYAFMGPIFRENGASISARISAQSFSARYFTTGQACYSTIGLAFASSGDIVAWNRTVNRGRKIQFSICLVSLQWKWIVAGLNGSLEKKETTSVIQSRRLFPITIWSGILFRKRNELKALAFISRHISSFRPNNRLKMRREHVIDWWRNNRN